jgi:hypothetical protein
MLVLVGVSELCVCVKAEGDLTYMRLEKWIGNSRRLLEASSSTVVSALC